ncbi:MAG: ATP-binding protein [Proteobacteria bacterium]|nr:ATP-binding protein [Pseudomonadota bacterium]
MRINLKHKVVIAFLSLSLFPILLLAFFSFSTIREAGKNLIVQMITELEGEESKRLIREAENYAHRVTMFLKEREKELRELSNTPLDEENIIRFWSQKRGRIWYAKIVNGRLVDTYETLPLYKEIAIIDKWGKEKVLLKNGKIVDKKGLRNVKDPSNTTYKNEDYFLKASRLKKGEIYVSSLKGFAMTKKDQIGNAKRPDDIGGGNRYDGVIRFSMPIYRNDEFNGVLTIALDHIHFQELTIHIVPRYGENVVFASYDSGNYAFIFDDSGWIITHPKYWDFPGVWKDGKEKRYMTENSTKRDIEEGIVGFNLDHVGFLSEGYPKAARDVRNKKSGIVTVTNVGGIKKVMAYAPIFYDTKPYDKLGIFGGFTIGAKFEDFYSSAVKAENTLIKNLQDYERRTGLIFLFIFFSVTFIGYFFSRHITEPITKLVEKIRFMGDTDFQNWEKIERKDEIGELAQAFYEMNKKINEQKSQLLNSMRELENAKKQLEEYNLYLKQKIDLLKDEELRKIDRFSSIGQLASGIAHEIRNPLTGITLLLDDLHDRIKDNESKALIVSALSEIERLERLVAMLLDYATPKSKTKERINIDIIIDDIFVFLKKMCDKKEISVERKRLLLPAYINGDGDKIKQAFLNIILNAIQHMNEGGKLIIDERKETMQGKSFIIISIFDTGPGIKETDIDKIFEPFYSLREGGTGLGLAISKSIINEHSGTIFAKNTDMGACFEIWIPEDSL